ncbi:MAG: ABC transporter permease, partial [Deltaproteobacteria bacterium]|nr:ABC transporter permease [Deltaproteobacteria bacterium]
MNEAATHPEALARPVGGLLPLLRLATRGRHLKILVWGLIFLALVVTGLLAPVLAPHDPQAQVLEERLRPPAWHQDGSGENLLGADNLGRDVLSRIIYGSRISLLVGLVTVTVAA